MTDATHPVIIDFTAEISDLRNTVITDLALACAGDVIARSRIDPAQSGDLLLTARAIHSDRPEPADLIVVGYGDGSVQMWIASDGASPDVIDLPVHAADGNVLVLIAYARRAATRWYDGPDALAGDLLASPGDPFRRA